MCMMLLGVCHKLDCQVRMVEKGKRGKYNNLECFENYEINVRVKLDYKIRMNKGCS